MQTTLLSQSRILSIVILTCIAFSLPLLANAQVWSWTESEVEEMAGGGVKPGECVDAEGNSGLVPCGCDTATYELNASGEWEMTSIDPDGKVTGNEQCSFGDLLLLVNNIIQWIILFAVALSAIMFAFAGWLYISAQGSETQISRAHGIFKNVGFGLVIALAAWLIVWSITTALIDEDESNVLQFLESEE